jgi:hypothetical protein
MKPVSILVGVLLTLFGGLPLLIAGSGWAEARSAAKWLTVEGRVLDSTLEMKGESTKRYSAHVKYEYVVDGNPYQGDRLALSPTDWSSDRAQAEQTLAEYQPNTVVEVYYDPESPGESALDTRVAEPGVLEFLAGFGGVLALCGVYLVWRGLPRRGSVWPAGKESFYVGTTGSANSEREGAQLQTAALPKTELGRTTFVGKMGMRDFQVFAFDKGLLFLDLGNEEKEQFDEPGQALGWVGAICGGYRGARVGALMEQALVSTTVKRSASDYAFHSDDDLIELAKERPRSFVARYEEIETAAIEAPDFFERLCHARDLQGFLTLREGTVGKVRLRIVDLESMREAIDTCSQRLGDRLTVRAEFDQQQRRFVSA